MVQRTGNRLARATALVLIGAALAGCAGGGKDKRLDPSYTAVKNEHAFAMALQKRYLDLATRAYDRGDAAVSDFYALRSIMAVEGKLVAPHPPTSREEKVALHSMTAAFETGARHHAPEAAARAQSFYDCWVVETGPQGDADQGTACRRAALAAIGRMDPALAAAIPVTRPAPQPAFQVVQAPVQRIAAPVPAPVTFAEPPLVVAGVSAPVGITVSDSVPVRPIPASPPLRTAPLFETPVATVEAAPDVIRPAAPAPVYRAVTAFPEPAPQITDLPAPLGAGESLPLAEPLPVAQPLPRIESPVEAAPVVQPAPVVQAPRIASLTPAADAPLYEEPVRPSAVTMPTLVAPGEDAEAAMAATARALRTDTAVYFDFDSDEITPEADDILMDIAASVASGGVRTILLMGHTDSAGANRYNQLLALRRAQGVRAALEKLIDTPVDFEILPVGETALAQDTADGIAEALNRRVEIVLR